MISAGETPDFLETYEGDPSPWSTCALCHEIRDDVDTATEMCGECVGFVEEGCCQ